MFNFRSLAVVALLSTGLLTAACVATRTQQAPGESACCHDQRVLDQARQINVETYRGVVQLSGFVDSSAEKSAATTVARSVSGVQEVRNDLELEQR